jgi:tetratricopeptide (TPR) repeat protein
MDRYLAKRPNDPHALYVRGLAHLLIGFLAQAGDDMRAVLAQDPSHVSGRAVLAEIYRRVGDIQKAIEESDKTLDVAPHILRAQLTRIELLAELHRWNDVVRVSEQVFRLDPTNARAVRLTGTALNTLVFSCK